MNSGIAKYQETAVHLVLRNDDILPDILKYLEPFCVRGDEAQAKERRCALSRLSQVCKAFKDPALSLLWRYQDNLQPIFDIISDVDSLLQLASQDEVRYFRRGLLLRNILTSCSLSQIKSSNLSIITLVLLQT